MMIINPPKNGAYIVITRVEKDPNRMGRKLIKPWDATEQCRIPCTGSMWHHPCDDENYENCDRCPCNHCSNCPCKPEKQEETKDV